MHGKLRQSASTHAWPGRWFNVNPKHIRDSLGRELSKPTPDSLMCLGQPNVVMANIFELLFTLGRVSPLLGRDGGRVTIEREKGA